MKNEDTGSYRVYYWECDPENPVISKHVNEHYASMDRAHGRFEELLVLPSTSLAFVLRDQYNEVGIVTKSNVLFESMEGASELAA